jgi:hypothetical protein
MTPSMATAAFSARREGVGGPEVHEPPMVDRDGPLDADAGGDARDGEPPEAGLDAAPPRVAALALGGELAGDPQPVDASAATRK